MKVLVNSDEESPIYKLIKESFCLSCVDKDHYESKVYFLSSDNIPFVSNKNDLSSHWMNSFAITQSFPLNGDRQNPIHLIILNEGECDMLNLSEMEKISVIIHELGHIFNRHPKLDGILTLSQCLVQGVDYPSEQAKENRFKLEDEYYADYFAIKHGFKDELTSCLRKSIASDRYEKLRSQFIARVNFITSSGKELNGVRKQFRTAN
jgi:Zn-dependent protease with chaperone function